MARVAADIPYAATVTVVDPNSLGGGHGPPRVSPETGLPEVLRAYVVVKDPRMTVIPHFLSEQECDHLLQLVEGSWNPSLVGQATYSTEEDYGSGNLENMLSTTRTSWSCMLRYAQTAVVERIEHRLASLAGLPLETLERMNMVRYAPGELFDEHHDGKFRPVTVFVYLNELPEEETRGDTFFPLLGVSFKPRRGAAIMWFNSAGDQEDSRMLHCGRAPTTAVKYGVNCFFNVNTMREVTPTGPELPLEAATIVQIGELGSDSLGSEQADPPPDAADAPPSCKEVTCPRQHLSRLVAYRLFANPSIVAVPGFLTKDEVEFFISCSTPAADADLGAEPFGKGTRTLRHFRPAESPSIEAIEARLASTAGLGLDRLAGLRLVSPGSQAGLCNRGCGPKSAHVCLSEAGDEVFFLRLGLRLVLRPGDLVVWPNVDWESGKAVEDVRSLRLHLGAKSAVGLDAHFHDNPLREQQKLRQFVPDAPPLVVACEIRPQCAEE